ncbi:MAG: pirin family protein [Crocinitomicaceae bacterium]|nr:pirin family protein [Crocinitomicaceae bacterium]NCA20285.1 pirin family protein [Crocinitomicaceae bacterium]
MKNKIERRNFLSKLTLGLSSIAVLPFVGWSKENESNMKTEKNTIKKIRALGFQWETSDPFLFCVHHEDFYPKGNKELGPNLELLKGRHIGQDFIVKDGFRMYHGTTVPGFPGHPHRGFETITVVRKGLIDHADSTGAAGRYGDGDVQWMTAGKGVQHSEMFPLLKQTEENPMELFQIWLNLPKKSKMVEPHFKMIWAEEIPKFTDNDANGNEINVEVLVGKLDKYAASTPPPNSWAADENNAVAIYNIQLAPNAEWTLPATLSGVNRTVFYYEGNGLQIEQQEIPHYHAAEVDETASLKFKNGNEASKVLVLQGRPISEPVVQHGPFVMNTKEEIYQAFDDYQKTQFGGWPWPKYDYVHAPELGRFARHSDGKEEHRG